MEMLSMHSPTCLKNNSAAHPANPSHPVNNAATPTQLSPTTPQTPMAPTAFCNSSPDMNAQHHHPSNYCDPYHSYGSVGCSFGGAYSTGGVDNGCMA